MFLKIRSSELLVVLLLLVTGCAPEKIESLPDERPLGASADDFLSDKKYTSLTIEAVYVEDFAPTAEALSELKHFLETYLNKPDGIKIVTRSIAPPGMGTYSISDLKEVEDKQRSLFSSGNDLSVFIFFADDAAEAAADDPEYTETLGTAYKSTSIAIYEKTIRNRKNNISRVEHTTLRHEFGHLMGLVDNGSPAQTPHVFKDPNNPDEKGHCNEKGCLMAASLDFLNFQTMNLDPKCHQDLVANGGK